MMKLVAHAILCAAVLIAPSAATGGFNYDDYNVDDNNGGYLNGGYSNSASGRSQYGYDNFGDVDGAYASTYGRNEVPSLNSYSNHPSERLPSSYYTSGRYQNYPNRAMSSNTRTDASAASNQPVRSRYSRNVQPQNVDASLSSASGADNIKSGWHSRLNSRVYADQNQQYSAPIRSARKFSNAPQSSTAGNQPAVSSNSESSSSPAALVPQTQQQAPNFQNFDATPDQSNVVALGKQHTAIAPSARSSALTPQRVSPGSDVPAPADAPVSNSQDSNGQNYYPSSGTSSDQGDFGNQVDPSVPQDSVVQGASPYTSNAQPISSGQHTKVPPGNSPPQVSGRPAPVSSVNGAQNHQSNSAVNDVPPPVSPSVNNLPAAAAPVPASTQAPAAAPQASVDPFVNAVFAKFCPHALTLSMSDILAYKSSMSIVEFCKAKGGLTA